MYGFYHTFLDGHTEFLTINADTTMPALDINDGFVLIVGNRTSDMLIPINDRATF